MINQNKKHRNQDEEHNKHKSTHRTSVRKILVSAPLYEKYKEEVPDDVKEEFFKK